MFGRRKRSEERLAVIRAEQELAEAKRHAEAKAYRDKVRSNERYSSKDLEEIYEQVRRENSGQWFRQVTEGEPKWEPYQSRYDIPPRQEPVEPWHVATSIPEPVEKPQGKTLDELFAEDEETDD